MENSERVNRPTPPRRYLRCGNFAKRTRIPNLLQTDAVDIVAVCDSNLQAANEIAAEFEVPHVYHTENEGAYKMLDAETIDVLYSIVPRYVRTDVEVTAVAKGIHLFSEKPQAITMQVARRIDDAVQQAGVISTVGFRERYRPPLSGGTSILGGQTGCSCPFSEFRWITTFGRGQG